MDVEKWLVLGAVMKFLGSEPLSVTDVERMIKVFESSDIRVDVPDQQSVAGLQTRLRSVIAAKYLGNK